MIKTTLIAGALLALTGATMSPASAAPYRANAAYRGAAAYRTPVAQTRIRVPVRAAVRLPYRRTLAAAPLARVGYGRVTRPVYNRVAQLYGRRAYRGAGRIVQPAAYGRYAYRGQGYRGQGYRGYGYGRYARRAVPVGARRLTALAPSTIVPSAAAVPVAAPAAGGGGMVGGASYYSGGRTASGGFVGAATCAHRSLPFGTRLLVTNMTNARATVCTVNDRGPFIGGRVVDLSRGAAGAIGMLGAGVARVRLQIMGHS